MDVEADVGCGYPDVFGRLLRDVFRLPLYNRLAGIYRRDVGTVLYLLFAECRDDDDSAVFAGQEGAGPFGKGAAVVGEPDALRFRGLYDSLFLHGAVGGANACVGGSDRFADTVCVGGGFRGVVDDCRFGL